jgi:nucleotide-binding universal stress UspA family protein
MVSRWQINHGAHMNPLHSKSVVVGVDGSQAAVNAARWAVDEAISRRTPLRLVYVIPRVARRIASARASEWELKRGEMALRQADCAVRDVGKRVEVETAVFSGEPEPVLINESRSAALICVGTTRHGWTAEKTLDPTAAALATQAHCPVAIIRTDPGEPPPTRDGVIAVVLNDEPDTDEIVHYAIEEGRRRRAIVRQIDRRLNSQTRHYPDVPVQIVAAGSGAKSGENHSSAIQLAVVGKADADQIADLATSNCHPIAGYLDCSLLLVRH